MVKPFKLYTELPVCNITATFDQCSAIVIEPHITGNSHVLFFLCRCKSL